MLTHPTPIIPTMTQRKRIDYRSDYERFTNRRKPLRFNEEAGSPPNCEAS
jgi:hypothetical protein